MLQKPSYQQFVCLAGLPRSGSTLLSAILSQNPKIHAEGNSALCQLMWDMRISCSENAKEQLVSTNRYETASDLLKMIPHYYYKDITETIVVDKCRSWTAIPNLEVLQKHIDPNFKIIVLERPITDVVKSFVKLYHKNNIYNVPFENNLLLDGSEPIVRSLEGIQYVKQLNKPEHFLFITYDELVNETKTTLKKIYDFCGWDYFEHNLDNIVNKYPENDDFYKLPGMHIIRSSIQKEQIPVKISEELSEKCKDLDDKYFR
jgi:sulfotransferase